MSWKRVNIGSRMSREVHVRFWERPGVRFPRATRQKRRSSARETAFSNCGLSHKGNVFMSHRAHGSLRGRSLWAARPMMASGAGCLQRSAARSAIRMARPRRSKRDHPASVPVGQRPVPVEQIGVFLFGHAGNASLVQAKVVLSRHRRSITTAILRAVATAAFLKPLRAARRTAHALSGENRRTLVISTFAAS